MTTVFCMKKAVSIGLSRKLADRMTPVSPIPPRVARKRATFFVRLHSRIRPSAVASISDSTCTPKEPSRGWFLPCTSAAIMPPTVTNLVPGITGGSQPRGTNTSKMSASSTPASQVSSPVFSSNDRIRFIFNIESVRSGLSAASP